MPGWKEGEDDDENGACGSERINRAQRGRERPRGRGRRIESEGDVKAYYAQTYPNIEREREREKESETAE